MDKRLDIIKNGDFLEINGEETVNPMEQLQKIKGDIQNLKSDNSNLVVQRIDPREAYNQINK